MCAFVTLTHLGNVRWLLTSLYKWNLHPVLPKLGFSETVPRCPFWVSCRAHRWWNGMDDTRTNPAFPPHTHETYAGLEPGARLYGSHSSILGLSTWVVLHFFTWRWWKSDCLLHFVVILIPMSLIHCSVYFLCCSLFMYNVPWVYVYQFEFGFLLVHIEWDYLRICF